MLYKTKRSKKKIITRGVALIVRDIIKMGWIGANMVLTIAMSIGATPDVLSLARLEDGWTKSLVPTILKCVVAGATAVNVWRAMRGIAKDKTQVDMPGHWAWHRTLR